MERDSNVVDETIKAVANTEKELEKVVAPVRKKVIKKHPVLFLMLVTLGFTATISGMEQLLFQIDFLQNQPIVVLIIGLVLLLLTGTLYKKLG